MEKNTIELFHELQHTKDIDYYIEENSTSFINVNLAQYLKAALQASKRRRSIVIRSSGLKPSYAYQIFSGLKRPTRDKFIALLIALNFSLTDIQSTLRMFSYGELYVKNKRDAYILYALEQHMNVMQCNLFLTNHGEDILTE